MKKLLLFLLLSSFAFGQNIELLKSVNNLDSIATRELSEKIFEDYTILPERPSDIKSSKIEWKITYTLLPKTATKEEISEYMNKQECKKCVGIRFDKRTRGSNPDLNIKGEIYYIFKEARGVFLGMFPFWQKEVQPEATTDKTYESTAVYTYKNKDINIWLNFWRTDQGWMIRNMSDYSQPW